MQASSGTFVDSICNPNSSFSPPTPPPCMPNNSLVSRKVAPSRRPRRPRHHRPLLRRPRRRLLKPLPPPFPPSSPRNQSGLQSRAVVVGGSAQNACRPRPAPTATAIRKETDPDSSRVYHVSRPAQKSPKNAHMRLAATTPTAGSESSASAMAMPWYRRRRFLHRQAARRLCRLPSHCRQCLAHK